MQERIVSESRTWIGTRFSHQGRRKKSQADRGGVDCLGLLIGVAGALGLKDKHGYHLTGSDRLDYSKSPDGSQLRETLAGLLHEIAGDAKAGDIALFRLDGNPQHLGILSDYDYGLGVIHAYAPSRQVVEHRLDKSWQEKIVAVFRLS